MLVCDQDNFAQSGSQVTVNQYVTSEVTRLGERFNTLSTFMGFLFTVTRLGE